MLTKCSEQVLLWPSVWIRGVCTAVVGVSVCVAGYSGTIKRILHCKPIVRYLNILCKILKRIHTGHTVVF